MTLMTPVISLGVVGNPSVAHPANNVLALYATRRFSSMIVFLGSILILSSNLRVSVPRRVPSEFLLKDRTRPSSLPCLLHALSIPSIIVMIFVEEYKLWRCLWSNTEIWTYVNGSVRGVSVGIATGCTTEESGFGCSRGRDVFCVASRPALELTEHPVQWVYRTVPGGKAAAA
jgi:hypothetical protein